MCYFPFYLFIYYYSDEGIVRDGDELMVILARGGREGGIDVVQEDCMN